MLDLCLLVKKDLGILVIEKIISLTLVRASEISEHSKKLVYET